MSQMSILSDKAKSDLILSIIAFLNENQLVASAKLLQEESQLTPTTAHNGLLERKWITVSRLQKRNMDLEKELSDLQKEIDKNVFRKKQNFDFTPLPKTAPKHTLEGHKGSVLSAAVHPIYTTVATGSEDSTIKIYDYETGDFERTCKGHTKAVNFVLYSKSGKLLVSASADTSIKFWDTDNNYQCIKTCYGHDEAISMLAFDLESKYLYSCSRDSTIREWDIVTGNCENVLFGHNEWIRCIDTSESHLASAGNDNFIKIWNLSTKQEEVELFGHEHVVETVKFVPKICTKDAQDLVKSTRNMSLLISAGRDKTIKLWDLITKECLYNFIGHENWIRSICIQYADIPGDFEYPSCIISVGDDRFIRVFDLRTGKQTKTIEKAHEQFINCVTSNIGTVVSPNTANMFVTTSEDYKIKIWQAV
eukprot:NODE_92_length_21718_cov_0.361950.p6 type:complete len:421 gc:universal NODE_92_length_21718_cov_0.361950:13723-12461(-)